VRLAYLGLTDTVVVGCAAFCVAGGPFHMHCDPRPIGCYCYC
jgi:hypothetical protein